MAVQIQIRRDLAANWVSANPILVEGEPGYETNTGKIKYGDGTTAWNSLAYSAAFQLSPYLQVANAVSTFQTKSVERAALANTNTFIATKVNTTTFNSALANTNLAITNVKTGLTTTNTAIRLLVSDRLQVANAVSIYVTKSNPTTSGLKAHTGRATISTNLDVSGNTTLGAAGKTISTTGVLAHTGRATISTNLTVSGNSSLGTIINTRFNSRVNSAADYSGTLTPNSDSYDMYAATGLTQATTIAAPTGTPVDGQRLMFRLLDNGTARALTWNATYTVMGVTLPTTTTLSKTSYIGCVYNAYGASGTGRWDVIAAGTQT